MRYFTQALAEDDAGRKDMLLDIATEELSHLEVIGNIVAMLNKGAKGKLAEAAEAQAELYSTITKSGNDSHVTEVLYGGGPALVNSAGVPWTAAYVDSIGDPTCDLRSNIAAEARAKILYERLINCTDDAGVRDALGFLMTREVAHQQQFEKALYSIQPNFPPGKLMGKPEFSNVYFNMSPGEGDERGPWNREPTFQYREAEPAVGGGDGWAEVRIANEEKEVLTEMSQRLHSDPQSDPTTGAMLGMRGTNGRDEASARPSQSPPPPGNATNRST